MRITINKSFSSLSPPRFPCHFFGRVPQGESLIDYFIGYKCKRDVYQRYSINLYFLYILIEAPKFWRKGIEIKTNIGITKSIRKENREKQAFLDECKEIGKRNRESLLTKK